MPDDLVIRKSPDPSPLPGGEGAGRKRLWTCVLLAVTAALGIGCKFYEGPGSGWAASNGAGLMYALFWTLAASLIWPQRRTAVAVAAGVFLACCLIEVSQLWHPAWLEPARAHSIGAALLGSTFSALDIPHYAAGCALGAAWIALYPGRP